MEKTYLSGRSIEKELFINATSERVFRALTEKEDLERWFMKTAEGPTKRLIRACCRPRYTSGSLDNFMKLTHNVSIEAKFLANHTGDTTIRRLVARP